MILFQPNDRDEIFVLKGSGFDVIYGLVCIHVEKISMEIYQ